jgi:hypothetical protein
VDNTKYPYIEESKISNKYLGTFTMPTGVGIGQTHNYFYYCYNAGKIEDTATIINQSAGILSKRMLRTTECFCSRPH